MRVLTLLATLLLAACEGAPELDKELTLAFSEERTLPSESLTLTFKELNEDSRCPIASGVQCGWAGRVVITVEASRPPASPETVTLVLLGGDISPGTTGSYLGYSITLLEITPESFLPQAPPEEYVATLLVHRD